VTTTLEVNEGDAEPPEPPGPAPGFCGTCGGALEPGVVKRIVVIISKARDQA
jgi:hypothetical protein